MEQFQMLIGNLTIDQFTRFIGVLVGCVFVFLLCQALAAALVDGWLFRKSALYYGSLRYLNKCFKKLRNCNSLQELDLSADECLSAIRLLMYQRTIPKIMYERLLHKCNQIHLLRKSEFLDYDDYFFNPF